MEDSFKSLIDRSKSLLILLPTNPYFDQVAGGLALYLALKVKKEVTIACPSPMTVEFNRLVGVNKITTELGEKNLTIKFTNYNAESIERVSYDIDNGEFQLSVIPKPQVSPPTKEQVAFDYSGITSDTIILVGGANENHFPAISSEDAAGAKLVHVGTRELTIEGKQDVISLARPASSVCEIITSLIKESDFGLDTDIATNLLMGIDDGSRGFSGSDVTADTFAIAAELMKAGGRRQPKEQPKRAFPQGALPAQPTEPQKKPQTPQSWLQPKIYKGTSIS